MNGIYDPFLVTASIVVAIIASFAALDLARSVTSARGPGRRLWLLGGSLAMGFGIWSMHFIGMLAFSMPDVTIAYDVVLLVLSIVVAVLASAIALWVVSRDQPTPSYFVCGGLAMGTAICGMHYIGMAAAHMAADIQWRWLLVLASIVIAIAASFAALWLAFRFRSLEGAAGRGRRLGAAVFMGGAIAGMHYTAMAAAVFIPTGSRSVIGRSDVLATDGLGVAVLGSTLLILTLALIGSIIERELARRSAIDERLRLALDAGGMAMWEWDPRTGRVMMSGGCRAMHGLPEEFDGDLRAVDASIHAEDRLSVRGQFTDLLERGVDYETDYRVVTPDGGVRWLRARGRRFTDGAGALRTIGICLDITARHTIEEQLRQSQKLEAIGHLAGGVAHDFNNVLTAVRGHVDLLRDGLALNDPRREDVEEIGRAARRATDLTRQLLAFARRQLVQPRVLDLGRQVSEMEPMLRRLIREDVELVGHFPAEPVPIRADPSQVQQIVMNLVLNARDAMPQGGRISVDVRPLTVSEPLDAVGDRVEPGEYALLTVADQGTGMESAVLERVFEPFFTTKPQGKGTGLGLSTVHGIATQAGGYVRVQTTPGAGTTFEVLFPAAAAGLAGPAEVAREEVDDGRRRGVGRTGAPAAAASILVVEDEPSVRGLVARVLRLKGYDVAVAASGSEALERLQAADVRCDLLVTDVVMPGMSGRELVERIGDSRPGLRVLFISGYTEDAVVLQRIDSANVDFLQKPFTPDQIARRVAAALAR
ncbi:MAG TPA: MHYT domain-containing protein [Longimicrobiales bacterium]|nr:MHYT domain-containing protein [Longimicrobiales bacterium]